MIAVGIDSNIKQFAHGPQGVDGLPNGHPYHGWIEINSGADHQSMCKIVEKLLDEVSSRTSGEKFQSSAWWSSPTRSFAVACELEAELW